MTLAYFALFFLALISSSCAQDVPSLTWEQLANTTYRTENTRDGTVTLENGDYEDYSQRVHITLPRRMITRGDFDGDGVVDAAVILISNTGGSGVFRDLCVVLNRVGTPDHVATQFLGDRIKINSFTAENGAIVLDMIVQGPDDPMCCPTLEKVSRYRLENGELVEAGTPEE